jgi:hypothetical protein
MMVVEQGGFELPSSLFAVSLYQLSYCPKSVQKLAMCKTASLSAVEAPPCYTTTFTLHKASDMFYNVSNHFFAHLRIDR